MTKLFLHGCCGDVACYRNSLLSFLYCLLYCLLCWQTSALAAGLDLHEQQRATTLAATVAWPESGASTAQPTRKQLIGTHPLGLQTLSVERKESKQAGTTRNAIVYQYDYDRDAARLIEIDMEHNALVRVQTIDSVHLPLNAVEIEFATRILAGDTQLVSQLRAQQVRRGQPPFVSLDELAVKASIFEPMQADHPCAASRCALLSLFDQTRTVFATEPVVFLKAQRVELLQAR